MSIMQSRMNNPVMILPGAMQALQDLNTSAESAGVSPQTITLIQLRASRINGCSVCVGGHCRILKQSQ